MEDKHFVSFDVGTILMDVILCGAMKTHKFNDK